MRENFIVTKNVKGGTLWDFFNIHSLQNIKKIDGGPFGAIKKIGKNEKFEVSQCRKKGKSHNVEKSGKGDPSALE